MPEVTTLRSFIADHSYDDAENLLALLDTALREAATEARRELDVEVLAKAMTNVPRCDLSLPSDEHHVHQSDAPTLAAEYRRLIEEA